MSLNGSLQWAIVSALRSYLIVSLEASNEEFSQLNRDTILVRNARDGFEFELTRVFQRQEPLFNAEFDRFGDLQAILEKFIVLLGENVNGQFQKESNYFGHLFQPLYTKQEILDSPLHRLSSLLEHLESSGSMFNLIRGRHGPAFNLPSEQTLLDDLKIVQELNRILDTLPSPKYISPASVAPPPPSLIDDQDVGVYDYAVETFRTVFEHLGTCGTRHKLMLYLPSSKHENPPDTFLDLLISVCPDHVQWQEARCGINLKIRPRTITDFNLCEVIEYSQSENEGLRIRVIRNEIENLSQVAERCRHNGDSPNICLRKMISDGAFKKPSLTELIANEHQLRFNPDQKKSLAVRIAVALSQLSGSKWVGDGWTAKDVYFLGCKKDDDKLPFGPFVLCSSDGPNSVDRMEWVAKLVKTPHLILFGKLLLEIDLGEDLDKLIDDELRKTPKKNISALLLGMYEKVKYHLLYGDAIKACLNFHKERKLRRETKEIDVPRADWCEWDRKYIRDNIVANLAHALAPQLKQPKKESVSHQRHDVKYKDPSLACSGPRHASEVSPFLRPSTYQTSDLEGTKGSGSAQLSKSPERAHYIGAINISQNERQSNKEVKFLINPTPHSPIQTTTIEKNTAMDAWLNEIDHTAPDEGLLFDDMEYSQRPEQASLALAYWEELKKFNNQFFSRTRQAPTASSIKIALIDTGVDMSDPLIKGEQARITGRSWVSDNPGNYHDTCGHGTHLVRLVLQASQTAHIFMAKVSDNKKFSRQNVENIAEAINWAVKEENAHIVSLSLGFKSEDPGVKAALEEAINSEMMPRRIVFAAGGNWGYNYPHAFPAGQRGVLRVHGVTGNGGDGNFNVKTDSNNRIATLGVAIESQWQGEKVWISGTSFATPIAAATAANVLEFAQREMKLDVNSRRWNDLLSFKGMRAVLRLMCTDTDKFEYMTPWHLGKSTNEIAKKIRDAIDYH
ncbi:hypothetical protein GGR58DRAFT_521141 [Xylaria digitata]|nr:hypothetical protein GGR58DRAFT_521141 [Xylaria digitata]